MKVVGVRFRKAGKVYYFDPLEFDIKQGSNVIVETARGVEFGYVVMGIRDLPEEKITVRIFPVLGASGLTTEPIASCIWGRPRMVRFICFRRSARMRIRQRSGVLKICRGL